MKQKWESQTNLRLLQVIQPLDGRFKKKSLPHLGLAVPKERQVHITAGDVAAAWKKAAEIWVWSCQEVTVER